MAVRNDFTAGEVLAAADLNDTFASKVDYALPTNAQTGTAYTFVAADAEKLTTASNGSAVTLTIPPASSVAWPDETILRVVNYGAGAVTIDGGSGVTVTNTASTIAQYGAAVAIRTGSDAWTVVPFGGGDVPSATVSSPAATGQYTDTGITYDYYTFTSSGTLTVDTAGLADVLIVGGGGAGGGGSTDSRAGGGGGSGQLLYLTQIYLPAGSNSVTVGAGGSGAVPSGLPGAGNLSSIAGIKSVGGGAGGQQSINNEAQGQRGFYGASGGGGSVSSGAVNNDGGLSIADQFAGATANRSVGAGGGGGAGGAGGNPTAGVGASNSITGSAVTYCAGGAGSSGSTAVNGTANTGNGGGGASAGATARAGGNGGSGVVIIRVKV